MRLGRILLASLAPLIGLSAFFPATLPATEHAARQEADTFIRLLQTVAQWAAPVAAEEALATHNPQLPPFWSTLGIQALSGTPWSHSLYLVCALMSWLALRPHPIPLLMRC